MAIPLTFGNPLTFGSNSHHNAKGRPTFFHREREHPKPRTNHTIHYMRTPHRSFKKGHQRAPRAQERRHNKWSNEGLTAVFHSDQGQASIAMNVDKGLKKKNTLEQEKRNLLIKLFDANGLITSTKIENLSLIEKVKSLESELSVAREQLDRNSTSKLDNMLNIQKSFSDRTRLGFVESVFTFVIHPPKFVPATSISILEVKVPKEETLATRRISVDLSESKPKKPTHPGSKEQHKP